MNGNGAGGLMIQNRRYRRRGASGAGGKRRADAALPESRLDGVRGGDAVELHVGAPREKRIQLVFLAAAFPVPVKMPPRQGAVRVANGSYRNGLRAVR